MGVQLLESALVFTFGGTHFPDEKVGGLRGVVTAWASEPFGWFQSPLCV